MTAGAGRCRLLGLLYFVAVQQHPLRAEGLKLEQFPSDGDEASSAALPALPRALLTSSGRYNGSTAALHEDGRTLMVRTGVRQVTLPNPHGAVPCGNSEPSTRVYEPRPGALANVSMRSRNFPAHSGN